MQIKSKHDMIAAKILRGGGCASTFQNQVGTSIPQIPHPNLFGLFTKFNNYIQIIESKAPVAANIQESSEILIAIQWFILQEQSIYSLNKNAQSVKKSYDLIIEGIRRLLKSCLIYIKTDSFKCLYILQITASLSKVIFSFHLINDQRYIKFEIQNSFVEICEELKQQIEIEKNDLIQNQIELFLFLTQASFEIAPNNSGEKEEILKGCLKGIINIELLESLFKGACFLYKRYDISQMRKQYEVFYQIDMLQWEVVSYFKDDKGKSVQEIILLIESMYEKIVKASKNWNDHYLWIQMIGKILLYNPLITQQSLGQLSNSLNFLVKPLSQIWKDYQNQGLLIQMNYDNSHAVIQLNQLRNSKTQQLDILVLENFFKQWESMIVLKEFLMNEQQDNIPYTFGSYLKSKLDLEEKEIDKNNLAINKMQKFLGFIIPRKLLSVIQQSLEKISQIDKIWKNFGIDKEINTKISKSTYNMQIKTMIANLQEYFQNIQYIMKFCKLYQKRRLASKEVNNENKNEFMKFQQLKYLLMLLEQILQFSIEYVKDTKKSQTVQSLFGGEKQKNEMLQKHKELFQNILQTFERKDKKLQFLIDFQKQLLILPAIQEKNFIIQAQCIMKLIEDSYKQIKKLEILSLQNISFQQCLEELFYQLYNYYEQIKYVIQQDFNLNTLAFKEIMILQYEIESVSSSEQFPNIENNLFNLKSIKFIQDSRHNLLKFKLQLISFKESFQVLLAQSQSIKFELFQEALKFDQFLIDSIQEYPQSLISCNSNGEQQTIFDDESIEATEDQLKNKLSKQKGTLQFLLLNINQQELLTTSEISDLEIIEKELGEFFEERVSSSQVMGRIDQLLESIPIENSIKNITDVKFDESQLKMENDIYENLLVQLKQKKGSQEILQIQQLINQTEILVESFKNSFNKSIQIFKIPLCKGLNDLRDKIEECKIYFSNNQHNKQENQDSQLRDQKLDNNNIQDQDKQQSKFDCMGEVYFKFSQNQKYKTNIHILIKIIELKNIRITKQKEALQCLLKEVVQFADASDFIQKQPNDIKQEMLKRFNSIFLNKLQGIQNLQWTYQNLQQQENEDFQIYFERISINLSEEANQIYKFENYKKFQQNQIQNKTNINDFIYRLKSDLQVEMNKTQYQFDGIQVEQEFIYLYLSKIYLQKHEEDNAYDDDQLQELSLFDNFIQKYDDFKKNDEWKIKQGLILTLIQISSNCFTQSLISFCQKALIFLWTQERDQRIRNLLKNQSLLSMQMQILQRDWKTQHDRIEGEMKQMLKKIDDLQGLISNEVNPSRRDNQLKELEETTKKLQDYIDNISEMGSHLRLVTDFLNHLRKGLTRIENKINEMKEQLNSMSNDLKFLRGKSVDQLLEIRKWRVLKDAAQKNMKSIFVSLKTLEKGKQETSNLMNLDQISDKEGEVNEFLLEEKQTVLLIHGVAGSGKSTIAKKIEEFIWKFQSNIQTNKSLIPIYISLPSLKNPVYQAVEETLHSDDYGFDELQLKECKEMLQKRVFRFLLIMDSYDEMKLENLQKNLYISNKIQQNWSNPQVIFTTRSEILQSTNYAEWFAPEDKTKLKEIKLLKFDIEQKKEYLQKFSFLSIKMQIQEIYELLIQNSNQKQIDENKFEMVWEQLKANLLKQQTFKISNSEQLLNQTQIKNILLFLKNDEFIALQSNEAIRSLNINLQNLWSVEKYVNIMKLINLDKLIETPYMMEIIVKVLPLMQAKAFEIDHLKKTFIKNFTKKLKDFLKRVYLIEMFMQQKIKLRNPNRQIENEVTVMDIQSLEKIDYTFAALQILQKMEQNSILIRFQQDQQFNEFLKNSFNIFEQTQLFDILLQGKVANKFQIPKEKIIKLLCDALQEQNLTSFDFYDEFIGQHHLKQIEKLRNLGKSINVDRFLHDLKQFSIKLAKLMSSKQLTSVQYKQQGFLYQDQNLEEEWLGEFFNDDGLDGSYKKNVRSSTLIQQKGVNFQFVHKSIQEFLIAADLYEILVLSKNLDLEIFNLAKKIISKKEKNEDITVFLQNNITIQDIYLHDRFENLSFFEKQQKFNYLMNNIQKLLGFLQIVKKHDFNKINYSSMIYTETRKYLIQKILNDYHIQECLKFLVQLTAIDDCFIQSGSNSFNLLVEMNIDLSKLNFENIKIKNTSLVGGNFAKCNLSGSEFDNVNINGLNLSGALLINCNWKNLRLNELHQLIGQSDCVDSICFSPDGATLASSGWNTLIILWDVKTGDQKQQLNGHAEKINQVSFSPDGIMLASGSQDKSICVWNVKTGQLLQQFYEHSDIVTSVCFSPDCFTLASGSLDNSIHLWDMKTGKKKSQLNGNNDKFSSVLFSPNGSTLVACSYEKNSIILWDVKREVQKLLLLHGSDKVGVISICFSPDGLTLASGGYSQQICLWDIETGEQKQRLIGLKATVHSVCFSPDGLTLASGGDDASICIWNVKTGKQIQQLNGHKNSVLSVQFSPDGTMLASGSLDESIRLWDVMIGEEKSQSSGHSGVVTSVCFSPDGTKLLSGSKDKLVYLWDVKSGIQELKLNGHSRKITSVCFSPDGLKIASGSKDKSIRLWDVKTGVLIQQLIGHTIGVQSIYFSPDGVTLASGGWDSLIILWDVNTGNQKSQLIGHSAQVYSVCFSPDCTILASGSGDKSIFIWDMQAVDQKFQLNGHTEGVASVCFSPDGATLASGGYDDSIILWDVGTKQQKSQFKGKQWVLSVCFSPDGDTLASSGQDHKISLWDVKTEVEKVEIKGHIYGCLSVCFSPDGTKLASGSYDQAIRIWDIEGGNKIQQDHRDYLENHVKLNNLENHFLTNNIVTIIFISKYYQLQVKGSIIFQGQFLNHLGMDLRRLFEQKGCILLDNQSK